jgi:hypothetical protein
MRGGWHRGRLLFVWDDERFVYGSSSWSTSQACDVGFYVLDSYSASSIEHEMIDEYKDTTN